MRKNSRSGSRSKTYKKYETLINEGTYWRLSDPFTDEIAAWMSVSEQQDHALVSVVRLMAEANQATVYVRLRGLKPDAVYLEEQSGRAVFRWRFPISHEGTGKRDSAVSSLAQGG